MPGFFYLFKKAERLKSFRPTVMGLVIAVFPSTLWAWGAVGHKTVAIIAQDHLTPRARAGIQELLNPGQDLASVSTWADILSQTQKETSPWHYLNLDVRQEQSRFDISEVCLNQDCVVGQIDRNLATLRERFAPRREKQRALKFLVHFVGDIHQPLHCADDGDRGGNDKWFRFYPGGPKKRFVWVNLHGFWDNLLQEKAQENPRRLASRLEKGIGPGDEREWSRGKAADWAYESFQIAKKEIYSELLEGPLREKNRWGKDLPPSYGSEKKRAIVDRQLRRAGLRLAWLLNGTFKKE
jgi:hypothetical protein